jgi:hypothetical protein
VLDAPGPAAQVVVDDHVVPLGGVDLEVVLPVEGPLPVVNYLNPAAGAGPAWPQPATGGAAGPCRPSLSPSLAVGASPTATITKPTSLLRGIGTGWSAGIEIPDGRAG